MGGVFSAPKPPAPLEVASQQPEDPEEKERAERLADIDRRRRGRQGTIQTAWRGLEQRDENRLAQKKLLGE